MTMREWVVKYCRERGMIRRQAEAVADAVAADEAMEMFRGRWDDQSSVYPEGVLINLAVITSRHARAFIDANCPDAWFRPMFDGRVR